MENSFGILLDNNLAKGLLEQPQDNVIILEVCGDLEGLMEQSQIQGVVFDSFMVAGEVETMATQVFAEREFQNKLQTLGGLRLPFLIILLGYCVEQNKCLLGIDNMPYKSLQELFFEDGHLSRNWQTRFDSILELLKLLRALSLSSLSYNANLASERDCKDVITGKENEITCMNTGGNNGNTKLLPYEDEFGSIDHSKELILIVLGGQTEGNTPNLYDVVCVLLESDDNSVVTEIYIWHRYHLTVRSFYAIPCYDTCLYSNSFDVLIGGKEIILEGKSSTVDDFVDGTSRQRQ
ncbi:hypothetical protein V6N12_043858 [Hibiscus sabdariffa]|uniref:Uncharacterized protein n=1 Tax=Hibiscus sabdariffa TaxID=183260 RepID=A0ABR2DFK7_9ROSI